MLSISILMLTASAGELPQIVRTEQKTPLCQIKSNFKQQTDFFFKGSQFCFKLYFLVFETSEKNKKL